MDDKAKHSGTRAPKTRFNGREHRESGSAFNPEGDLRESLEGMQDEGMETSSPIASPSTGECPCGATLTDWERTRDIGTCSVCSKQFQNLPRWARVALALQRQRVELVLFAMHAETPQHVRDAIVRMYDEQDDRIQTMADAIVRLGRIKP